MDKLEFQKGSDLELACQLKANLSVKIACRSQFHHCMANCSRAIVRRVSVSLEYGVLFHQDCDVGLGFSVACAAVSFCQMAGGSIRYRSPGIQ